jgi:Cu(I)/Ag(I) efflux system protein CusF
MKHVRITALSLAMLAVSLPMREPLAQHSGHGHHHPTPSQPGTPAATSASTTDWADGEVRRIDREQGRITLRHGEIRSLDMPPMTMVFQVANPSMLESLAPGDRIRFQVVADGTRYRITALEKQ